MKCPYCGGEMLEGALSSLGSSTYTEMFFWPKDSEENIEQLNEEFGHPLGYSKVAYACRTCKKAVAVWDYKKK